jgi:hypothetical protein
MPDFDSFERIFKSVVGGEISEATGAGKIFALEEANKVLVVKGRTKSEIEDFLLRASSSLRSFFPSGAKFTSSDDNRSGKDLFEVSTNTQVELKSGASMTEANSGLGIISWATGDVDNKIPEIMNQGMVERRRLALAGKSDKIIEASKSESMDKLADHLRTIVEIGPASAQMTHFLKSVAAGITNQPAIINSFGSKMKGASPLLLEASWDLGLKLYSKAFLPSEEIVVKLIERTKDRAQLIAEGVDSNRKAKIYPNFKNSWKSQDGRKVPASNWVSNACFHVWIK